MLDDAPVRFSVTNCWPRIWPILAPTMRAVRSAVEPGAKPLMTCTGWLGNSCAGAAVAASSAAVASAAAAREKQTMSSSLYFGEAKHDLIQPASHAGRH